MNREHMIEGTDYRVGFKPRYPNATFNPRYFNATSENTFCDTGSVVKIKIACIWAV